MPNLLNDSNWLEFEKNHVWHPYAPLEGGLPPYPVKNAQGVHFTLENGHQLIDGMSSWWSVIHGYNHPVINAAAKAQLDEMSHVMFGGLTHRPAAELAARLITLTPEPLARVFFCDSGSVSVEVAIKMVIQYWHSKGQPNKQRMLAIRRGYHGDTCGAMAVCDPETGMHHLFTEALPKHLFAEAPTVTIDADWRDEDIADFRDLIKQNHNEIAAVILEPLVQGAGGMRFYAPEYLRQVRSLCDSYDVLLIVDEIATGFGRTGTLFACEQADIVPDIMCLGKAITGGYMSLAATLTTAEISQEISRNAPKAFMHGPTFMANPLACATANASIDLLLDSPWQERIARMSETFSEHLQPCKNWDGITDVRIKGGIGVLELEQPVDMSSITRRFVDKGVWVRPFGKLVYVMPPYIIKDEELNSLLTAMTEAVAEELGI
jgi:adenosylmethionine-8-amino-7-oxononanoate aminotransferase